MDYFLTEEQQMIKEIARKIAEEKIKPVRAELDEKEKFPRDLLKVIAQSDLFGVCIPQEYGGFGGGSFENCLAVEELSRGCLGVSTSFAASGLGAYPILLYGSEEQKKKYLPEIASGRKLAAFALTESTAGSDAGGIMTTAELKGNEYVLNGTKQWITNAGEADLYSVIAITDRSKGPRGASAFIVEKGDPGFGFGKKESKMGIRASATGELIFNQCRIPKERIIAREGMGFILAMKTFDHVPSGSRCPGGRPGPGRPGRGRPIRPDPDSVRETDHNLSGRPTYAGRYGHPNRGGPGPGLFGGPICGQRGQRCLQGLGHGQGLCQRCGHEGYDRCGPGLRGNRLYEGLSG